MTNLKIGQKVQLLGTKFAGCAKWSDFVYKTNLKKKDIVEVVYILPSNRVECICGIEKLKMIFSESDLQPVNMSLKSILENF